MATHTQVMPDTEPTPEFNSACTAYIQGWQHGDIPASQVVTELKTLVNDALANGHIANQARAEHLLGYIQHYMGNLSISIRHYDTARQLFDRVGNRTRMVTMDINQGENYRFRGEFKRARYLYRQAYEAAQDLANLRLQTIAVTNEGLMLISMREYAQAHEALITGLDLAAQWKDESDKPALLTEIYFGLAQVSIAIDAHETAWNYAHDSLKHARQGENHHSIGLAYRILGDALTDLGEAPSDSDFAKPDKYYQAALKTFREIDAQAEIGRTIYSYAVSYAKRQRRRHAAQLFREAMVIFTHLGMVDDAANAAEAQLQVT